jgi:dipeptidyl aminopeptidase/acylaminoacyl peptidase
MRVPIRFRPVAIVPIRRRPIAAVLTPAAALRPAAPLLLAAVILSSVGLVASEAAAQSGTQGAKRPMTAKDLWSMGRVGAPAVSPDGKLVAYPVTWYDLTTFRGNSDIWVVPVEGGEPRQMTNSPGTDTSPAWSPDGKWIAFVSTRGGKGAQIHLLPAAGGEARPLTSMEGGATGPVWSRDGKKILFVSEVWPKNDPLAERMQKLAETGSSAQIYDELGYRHWDTWEDGMRSHVFSIDVAGGQPRDLTPGPYDTPPIALGGFQDYDLSPDGAEFAFVRNITVPTMVGTGNDIWLVPVAGGEPKLLTESKANDTSPQYSPDGRWIAYLAMKRPGFESDRSWLVRYDRRSGERRWIEEALDRSVDSFVWAADSASIVFLCGDHIWHSVYRMETASGRVTKLTDRTYDGSVALLPDGRMVVARQSNILPTELFLLDAAGRTVRPLTRTNERLLSQLSLSPPEVFTFKGARNTDVEGYITRPPGFDPARKYPLVYLVHGGPQGAWTDNFHYRWNPVMFAAPGYVVLSVNPRGSTGYGQQFTDEISQDWGGKVFEDLMKGLDHALKTYPFIDRTRMAAAGASYGGYMMNWFEGHTDRFLTLVNHDGTSNTMSMYGTTEELWFPEWEFGGTPWSNPKGYEKWNPMAAVADFKTPMLIIHGQLDYRLDLSQGLEMFTTLRRKGVRARFLYFPDESHWVLQPQNAFVWWETIFDWLGEYLKP